MEADRTRGTVGADDDQQESEIVMQTLTSFVTRQSVLCFCALVIALSFAATQLPLPGEVIPIVLVGIPALIALGLTAMTDGWSGVRAFLAKPGSGACARAGSPSPLHWGWGCAWAWAWSRCCWAPFRRSSCARGRRCNSGVFALMLFVFAVPEELGWRGYALPKLFRRHSPLVAGLVTGVLWGSLHLALHVPGMIHHGLPLLPVVLEVTSLSVIGTWLYLGSGGNLVVTSVFHAAQSFFVVVNEGIPQAQQLWLMAGVYAGVALIVVLTVPDFARRSVATRAPDQPSGGAAASRRPELPDANAEVR